MAIIQCKECGGKVSDRATECPHCGCPIIQDATNAPESEELNPASEQELTEQPKSKLWLWVILAIVACAVGVGAYWFISKDKSETGAAESAIEQVEEVAVVFTSPDLEFNELHGEVSKVEWIKSDELWHIVAFSYDDEGNMYPVQSNDIPANSYYRNNEGQVIQEDEYQEASWFYAWKDGKVYSQIIDSYKQQFENEPNATDYYRYFHYSDNGLLDKITSKVYNGDDGGLVQNYEKVFTNYKFDDMGNWVSREATATYDITDWEDESKKHETHKSKEYRVIKYRNHESTPVKSIKDVLREWKIEQGEE